MKFTDVDMRNQPSLVTPNPSSPKKRPRNAISTRVAILKSALIAFSRAGYDGVGVRDIAHEAGVTAMLVNRYFGSKEKLFATAVETVFSEDKLLSGDLAMLSRHAARALVEEPAPGVEQVEPFLLMLHSASNPRAAAILRDSIERHFQQRLTGLLAGDEAKERAMLFLSRVAGFRLMHTVIGTKPLTEADPAALAKRLEAMFELLISPPQRLSAAPMSKVAPVPKPEAYRRTAS
jgi:AcrR family transcriptional regulator